MTWRELVYMITDITKQLSDDSNFNEDHIIFLCSKYRNYILNQQYLTHKKTISEANYQIITIPLEQYSLDVCPNISMLKSTKPVPNTMTIGTKSVYPSDVFNYRSKIVLVPQNRFNYSGNTSYNKSLIYAMIGPDNYIYLKSNNSGFLYLKSITIKALFEDIKEASLLDASTCGCDVMDVKFPLEDAWVNTLINLVVNDLIRGINALRDTSNDAFDSSDQLAQAISRYTNSAFRRLARGNQNNNNDAD